MGFGYYFSWIIFFDMPSFFFFFFKLLVEACYASTKNLSFHREIGQFDA